MANSNAIDCKHNGTGTNTTTIKRLNESVSLWGNLSFPAAGAVCHPHRGKAPAASHAQKTRR